MMISGPTPAASPMAMQGPLKRAIRLGAGRIGASAPLGRPERSDGAPASLAHPGRRPDRRRRLRHRGHDAAIIGPAVLDRLGRTCAGAGRRHGAPRRSVAAGATMAGDAVAPDARLGILVVVGSSAEASRAAAALLRADISLLTVTINPVTLRDGTAGGRLAGNRQPHRRGIGARRRRAGGYRGGGGKPRRGRRPQTPAGRVAAPGGDGAGRARCSGRDRHPPDRGGRARRSARPKARCADHARHHQDRRARRSPSRQRPRPGLPGA